MRPKSLFLICTTLLVMALAAIPALSQKQPTLSQQKEEEEKPPISLVPLRQEQLVYSFNVFDGKGWSGGFCPQSEDTIYLIANKYNAVSARKTLIYFWPITAKYLAAWRTLNEDVEGILEILKDGKVIEKLEKKDTVLCYPEGYWSEKVELYVGDKANEWYQKYKKAEDAYYKALEKYYEARTEYRKKLNEFFEEVKKRREAGEKGPLDIEIPKEPKPPEGPNFYVTNPTKNYVINLPVGRYQIRLRAADGTIVEGSEKNILVFVARRKGGVGYKIIPGNRWTKEEECNDPANVIYAAGKNLLYFRPYWQNEYNELYHNKLLDPQNEGRIESWKWVHTEPIKDVFLLFYGEDKLLSKVEKKPYKVEQVPGPELGYNIVEFKGQETSWNKPTFEGHLVTLSEDLPKQGYRVYLQKKGDKKLILESEREIRLVNKKNVDFLYYLSIFPLIVGGIVFTVRWRRVKK